MAPMGLALTLMVLATGAPDEADDPDQDHGGRAQHRDHGQPPSPRRAALLARPEPALQDRLGEVLRLVGPEDRKSTRLNSSHTVISYAVFCLKKKKKQIAWVFYKKKEQRKEKTK